MIKEYISRDLRINKIGNIVNKNYIHRFYLSKGKGFDFQYMFNTIIATINYYKIKSFGFRAFVDYLRKKHKYNKKCAKQRSSWEKLFYILLLTKTCKHYIINGCNIIELTPKFFETFKLDYNIKEANKIKPEQLKNMIKQIKIMETKKDE